MSKKKAIRQNILSLWKQCGKERCVKIEGSSMRPLITRGSSIRFIPVSDPEMIRIGDIAVFQRGTCIIAHRIVGRIKKDGDLWFKEKGDNRFYPDSIGGDAIIGRVTGILQNGVCTDLTAARWICVNRLLGYYWKYLFAVMGCITRARRLLFAGRNAYLSGLYTRAVRWLLKLPQAVLRLRRF